MVACDAAISLTDGPNNHGRYDFRYRPGGKLSPRIFYIRLRERDETRELREWQRDW
jgi:hypothetical protein